MQIIVALLLLLVIISWKENSTGLRSTMKTKGINENTIITSNLH